MIDIVVYSALVIFAYMTVFFFVSLVKKNNGLVDIGYGMGFIVISLFSYFYGHSFALVQTVVTAFVLVWGIRLSYRIGRRNIGKEEDFRYKKWREEWGKWVIPRSFFQIFMLQGLIIVIISTPVLLLNVLDIAQWTGQPLFFIGVALWAVGFIFEALGDAQLDSFIRKPENRGLIMNTGLWRYTRHPNYFGEALMWWSLWIIAISVGVSVYTVLSPLLITFLLLKVSGIPLLEKRWAGDPAYEEYKRKTSVFIPWFVKK